MNNYGKFFLDRNIFESDIWEKPPYYLKIFVWITGKANFKTVKKGGEIYHRGEFLTIIPKIIEANEWRIGWRVRKLSKDQVWKVLEFLRKTERITTRKTTRGLFIKVSNYDHYQRLPRKEKDSEANSETDSESKTDTNGIATASQYYKRKKEKTQEKNDKTINVSASAEEERDLVQELLKDPKRHVQIIGLYAIQKGAKFKNKGQQASFIKRNAKAASLLSSYSNEKIKKTMEYLEWLSEEKDWEHWTLETVGKYIDERDVYRTPEERAGLEPG